MQNSIIFTPKITKCANALSNPLFSKLAYVWFIMLFFLILGISILKEQFNPLTIYRNMDTNK